jgi:hypothetical protein
LGCDYPKKDGQDAGNLDAIEGNTVVITTEGDRNEYNLPKPQVKTFNGAEVAYSNVGIIIYEERPSSGISFHHTRSGTMIYLVLI